MEKKLLFSNDASIALTLSNMQVFRQRMQTVCDRFNELQLNVPMTGKLFNVLLTDAEGTVKNIFKERIPAIDQHTSLPIDKDSVLKSLRMPDLRSLREAVNIVNDTKGDGRFIPMFDVTDTVTVNEDKVNAYMDKTYKFFTDDPAVIKLYNQLNQIALILNTINGETNGRFIPNNGLMSAFTYDLNELFEFNSGLLRVSMKGFKGLSSKL